MYSRFDRTKTKKQKNLLKKKTRSYILSTDIFKTKSKLPQVHQQSEDIIIFDKIKISLKKLKPTMNKQRITQILGKYLQKEIQQHENPYIKRGLQSPQTIHLNVGLQIIPSEILLGVIEYKCHRYRFNNDRYKRIEGFQTIKDNNQLTHIDFKYLQQLVLKGQNIGNVQAITFINAPNLELLDLSENNIINIETLIKAQFTSLKQIKLVYNPIKKLQRFQRFNSKRFLPSFFDTVDINLQIYYPNKRRAEKKQLLENFGFTFKLEMKPNELCQQLIQTSYLSFQSTNKIPQPGISKDFLKNKLRKEEEQDLMGF